MDNIENVEIEKTFLEAANYISGNPTIGNQNTNNLLQLYGYYKQVTIGPCNVPRPSWYQRVPRAKHDAWSSLGDLSKEKSMEAYIQLVDDLAPNWRNSDGSEENHSWVTVSRLANKESILKDSEKTIFDWVKEGNLTQVIEIVKNNHSLLKLTDEEGMNPLHWACDRGHIEMVHILCERFGSDINVRDSYLQTPLHYAASCGYRDVIELLLKLGIDCNAKDLDGATAAELAEDPEIVQLLS